MIGYPGTRRRRCARVGVLAAALVTGVVLTATPASLAVPLPPPTKGSVIAVDRVGGANRYATAASLSAATISRPGGVAYVATGENFPDALAGGPAAAKTRSPVLLVRHDRIPVETAQELSRLQPSGIVVLGGSGAVSSTVATQLASFTTGDVTRLAGSDRFETSVKISAAAYPDGAQVAYVATGMGFPDALSGAAAAVDGPVLLVNARIPATVRAELVRLGVGRIVILGGTGAVSGSVAAALSGYAPDVTRWSGPDRYGTSAAVSAAAFPDGPASGEVYVATGAAFPDALAGGATAGSRRSPLLLVTPTTVPSIIGAELAKLKPARIIVLGGSAAIADAVLASLRTYLPAGGQLGSVAGVVRQWNTPGAPLGNVIVRAYQRDGVREVWSRATVTDDAGAFLLTGVPATTGVLLEYDGRTGTGGTALGGYATACRGLPDCYAPEPLSVPVGGTLTGQDVMLPGLGSVTGAVTNLDGSPAVGVDVRVCTTLYGCQDFATTVDGTYVATSVPATTDVYVCSYNPAEYTGGCFDGKFGNPSEATRFTVPTDGDATGKDIVLRNML